VTNESVQMKGLISRGFAGAYAGLRRLTIFSRRTELGGWSLSRGKSTNRCR
jgi:hypothetical protein